MKLKSNLTAGLVNSTWSALVRLAVVPVYVKFLGIEAYGLVGFFAATQALMGVFDFGLALTLNREVARCSTSGDFHRARQVMHTLAVIYWALAGIVAVLVALSAPLIASTWLGATTMPKKDVETAVVLIGLVIGCNWPLSLYQGALIGAQRITLLSGIGILTVTFSNLGAVAVIALISPTIHAFLVWQAGNGLLAVFLTRHAAWHVLDRPAPVRFDITVLRDIWHFSAGVTGIAISSIVLMQTDKILLSRILSLADFGRYTLAALAASALYVYLMPVFNVIYPRLSGLVAVGDVDHLMAFYRSGTRLLLAILFPLSIMGMMFSRELVSVWTGDRALSTAIAPTVSLFLAGTTLNGVMLFPYAIQLASGNTRLPVTINLILIAVMFPMTIALAVAYGAVGGAASWAILNLIYVGLGTWLTHRSILPGLAARWLIGDVGVPLIISLTVVGLGSWGIRAAGFGPAVSVIGVAGLCAIALATILLASPELRPAQLRSAS